VGAGAGYFFWKQHEAGEKRKVKDKANADFHGKYGPWAIITGAARRQGLGFGFARHLAARHFNLVLVDVQGEELEARADELRRHYHVKVKPVALDLGQADFMPQLRTAVEGLSIGLLICNHMVTPSDTPKFLEMELETLNAMLDVNARAYTTLLHEYGRQMAQQGRGGLIIIASQAALHGTPYTGAYAANKAYQLILGESLWYELQGTNVDALVVAPGLTNTQEDALAGYPEILLMEVDPVVSETLDNLGQRHLVIPGFVNKLFYFATTHLLSRQQAVEQTGQLMASGLNKN
jgi:short-subunit dehydrogenase